MKRRVSCSLNNFTKTKQSKLDEFFTEYQRVVNCFIDLYFEQDKLPSKIGSAEYHKVNSWLLGKAIKCAGNQAIKIIKSIRDKDKKLVYNQYKRIFAKCKKHNRNHFGILDKKYSEWIVGKKINRKVKKPIFEKFVIDLNSDLITIQDSKKSKNFDLWIRIGSVFGNRYSLILPSKKHKQFNKMIANGFELAKSASLRKIGNQYFVELYFEKQDTLIKSRKSTVGIDLGINKLLTLSDGRKLGADIKRLINKLHRRKVNSKNYKQTLSEIKCYIGNTVNKIGIENYDLIVMENLKNITKNTKGRVNKTTRKLLGNWNVNLVYRRIMDKCEENRVLLTFIEPSYTSQQCSVCGEIHKESRNGEIYKCIKCGTVLDADVNGAINILNRFKNEAFAVPHNTKIQNLIDSV